MKQVLIFLVIFMMSIGVALADDRNMLGKQKPDGTYEQVPKVGEHYNDTDHIYLERHTNGGWIIQYVDVDKDYFCDYTVVWKAFDDPTYGRFYGSLGRAKCP